MNRDVTRKRESSDLLCLPTRFDGVNVIQGRVIVCVASAWDYDPTSKHHLMSLLSEHNDIIWVNYHGSRRPGFTISDVTSAVRTLGRATRGLQRISPSMVQMTPWVIPGAKRPVLRRLHQRALIAQIRRSIGQVDPSGFKPVQVWTFAPDTPFLQGAFGEECFVYYCVDEYTQFEGFDAPWIAAAEKEQIERADLVVTTSELLFTAKSRMRSDAVLVRHGVDNAHFERAWQVPLSPPAELDRIPRPIFGFFGLIQHWVDLELLGEVARRRPEYSFVLLGDCRVSTTSARGPNVHFLGRRPYATIPEYCAAFDAGMLLFRQNAMARHVNPIKMFEYLAAGLPVVSTPLPEAERYPQAIRIADGADAFAESCDAVLAEGGSPSRGYISGLVARETWSSRVETLSGLIAPRAADASPPRSMPSESIVPHAGRPKSRSFAEASLPRTSHASTK